MRASWIRALILVVVLVGGVITPVAPVGEARATPSGFVTIPDANVHEDLPVDRSLSISKEDLEGSVMVSDNASTTEIVVTTSERAEGYLDNGTSVGGGSLALVIQDDTNHAGREVAIPADAVKGSIGRLPEAVHGTHEDGSEWTSQVRAESGLLIFEVPHFSSNTVTFSGGVSISGTYTDGSSVSYSITSLDAVSDFNVTLSGVKKTETDMHTGSVTGSGSYNFDVSGNAAPSNGNLDVSGSQETKSGSFSGDGYNTPTDSVSMSTVSYVSADIGGLPEGTDVTVNWYKDSTSNSPFASQTATSAGVDGASVSESVSVSGASSIIIELDAADSTVNADYDVTSKGPTNVQASVDGSTYDFGDLGGGSASKSIDLTRGSKTLDISHDGPGSVSYDLSYVETSLPANPSININGNTTGYSGTLADGETANLSVNKSWIQSETNEISVSINSLSTDAPSPAVSMDYGHETTDKITVNYTAEGWTERYNTSRTFSSTQDNPTFSVPFQGTITEISRLEERTDGGSWESVPSSRFSLDGSELTVQLDDGDGDGDVDAGTNMSVRVAGRHVKAVNGAISVTDPILPGEDADVEFRIDSKSSGFYIDLSNVPDAGVRYTYQESWSSSEDHMIVTAEGDKRLKLPNAPSGGSARVTFVPVTVTPESGDARVSVADPDEPTITMGPGSSSGDDVTIRYLEASTGTTYNLYSTSRDRIVAKEEADAGTVSFVEDDSAESLMINTTNSGGGGGGLGFDTRAPADYGSERPVLVMGALAALVIGLVWATGRTGLSGRSRWALVGGVSLGLGLISLESLYPGAISQRIGEGIATIFSQVGTVVPIAGIGAVVIVGYTVVSWWQSRKNEASTPNTKVTFSLGDRNK